MFLQQIDERSNGAAFQPSKRQKTTHDSNSRLLPSHDWLDCPNFGQDVAGFIIPSKSPLGEDFNIDDEKSYSVKQMMKANKHVGLIIDLTNTTPSYNLQELDGVKHVKIPCDSVPDNDSVNQFVYEVSQFEKQSSKQILVHCTNGFNRSGYMIAHYLKRVQPNMSVSLAIKIFADSRPPGIHKPKYIEALYDFYHEERTDIHSLLCPPTPDSKKGAIFRDDDHNDTLQPVNENGDAIPLKQQEELRLSCYELLKIPVGEDGLQFPGSRPVSMIRKNMTWLKKIYYRATWKTSGTRYLMLITLDGCYLVDSNFDFRRVQMRFPCMTTDDDFRWVAEAKLHHMTLLDGEMVIDTLPESGKQERRFLVCDMMAINGESISELPFSERWNMIEKEVMEPRKNEQYQSKSPYYYKYELEPFRVRRKDFWVLSSIPKLLKDFIPSKLTHPANGLVFQGWSGGYVAGAHHSLLEWSDESEDFDEKMLLSEMKKTTRLPLYRVLARDDTKRRRTKCSKAG